VVPGAAAPVLGVPAEGESAGADPGRLLPAIENTRSRINAVRALANSKLRPPMAEKVGKLMDKINQLHNRRDAYFHNPWGLPGTKSADPFQLVFRPARAKSHGSKYITLHELEQFANDIDSAVNEVSDIAGEIYGLLTPGQKPHGGQPDAPA